MAALAVILGAFGAHALKAIMAADQLLVYETGVRYQFYHSVALFITGILYGLQPAKNYKTATILFVLGILFFSGSLYAMSLLSIKNISLGPIGIITPIGGLLFILGWLFVLGGTLKRN
jgi:uncharacterized membrane protein YgdD (TMEM256/DUF423 family)